MKFQQKISVPFLSVALFANTLIVSGPAVKAAPLDDGLIDGLYYGISERDLPGWHGAWADWKLGPLVVNYSGAAEFSIERASRFDENKRDDDKLLLFTCPTSKDGKTQKVKLSVDKRMEKGDIYTFAFDLYLDPGAGDASNYVQVSMSSETAGIVGNYAEVSSANNSSTASSLIRDFGPGGTWYATGFDCNSYTQWDSNFVRYEVIIDTEDEEYGGEQTIEMNIRSDNYVDAKQHFKGTYYQIDRSNNDAKLDSAIERIDSINITMESIPRNSATALPIYFAIDNIRSAVYHDSKAARDAVYLWAEKGKCESKTFSTVADSSAAIQIDTDENETISFDVPPGETGVAYRDVTLNGATMNIAGHEKNSYIYADVLVPEGDSADNYYITLVSMPQNAYNNTGNALGVPLGKYYTTPGQMQRVEIPISEFMGVNTVLLPNSGSQYDQDALLMFLAGVGVARKSGTGSIEIGDMYIVGDVAAPTDLTDAEVVSGKIVLNWAASKNTMTEYEIYRNDELIATVDGDTTEYADTGLTNDSYYSYRIRGKCLFGKYTDYAVLNDVYIPAIGVPENVSFENVGGTELAVSCKWEAPMFGEPSGYIIYRDGNVIAELGAADTEYTDRAIEPNITYQYEICATMEGFRPSYRVKGEVLAAYVYAPENLSYDGSRFTWTSAEFAASYKLYINGREYAASETNSYTIDKPLEKNDILTVEVTALTSAGNESVPSDYIRIYEKKDKLEVVRNYYDDSLPGRVKIHTDNTQYAVESEKNVGIGEKSIAVSFTPLRRGVLVFRDTELGGEVSAQGGAILAGLYIPKNTDIKKLQMGLSYIPSGSNATEACAVVPVENYVKETGRWTVVEIPFSDIPQYAEYKLNNQIRNLQFDIKNATAVCLVGAYEDTDAVADGILVDEVIIGKYVAGDTKLVNESGGGDISSDETSIIINTDAGFSEKALCGGNASVRIFDAQGNEVPSVTVLDKNNTPKIILASRLEGNSDYTVKINGLADANGAGISKDIPFAATQGAADAWTGESIDVFKVTADQARANSSFNAYVSFDNLAVSSEKLNKLKVIIQATGNASFSKDIKPADLVLADCLVNAKLSYNDDKLEITADIEGNLIDKPIIAVPLRAAGKGSAELKANGRIFTAAGDAGVDIAEALCKVNVNGSESGGSGGGGAVSEPYNNKRTETSTQYGGQRPQETVTVPAAAKLSFSDVTSEHWAYDYINTLIDKRIINGYDDGTFRPGNSVTRAEFVTLLQSAFRLTGEINATFDDVQEGAWYAQSVLTAASLGIVSGMGDGTFAPNTEISRQDMCVMIKNVVDFKGMGLDKKYDSVTFTDSDDIADYAEEAINILKQAGVIGGYDDGSFRPLNAVTRAEAAKIIAVLIK